MRFSFSTLAIAAFALTPPGLACAQDLGVEVKATAAPTGGPAPAIDSQAYLTSQLSNVQAKVQVGLQTGADAGAVAASWYSGAANLAAVWTPTPLAKVEVSADNSLRLDFGPAGPVFADAAQRYVESRQNAGMAAITLTPAEPLTIRVGATSQTNAVHSSQFSSSGAVTSDLLETEAQQLFTAVEWKPVPLISLDGGGKLESTGVYWSGARAGSFAAVDPSVGATVKPWDGAAWRFTLDRAAAPLSTDQFIGYDTANAASGAMTLQPNREWRYKAAISQKAGPVDLTASFLAAQLQTFAYVAPQGLAPGRVDMGAGQRSEVQAGLTAPLPVFGFAPFQFKATGAWRTSTAQDPLTGAAGRLSGESPYDASLSLSQALWGNAMRWGMVAQATGPARTYFASQVTNLSATAGLGGFFEYKPGAITVRLNLDNLVGGDRFQRDVYYSGSRDLNLIDRTDQLRTIDRAIRVSLVRPL